MNGFGHRTSSLSYFQLVTLVGCAVIGNRILLHKECNSETRISVCQMSPPEQVAVSREVLPDSLQFSLILPDSVESSSLGGGAFLWNKTITGAFDTASINLRIYTSDV